MNKNYYLCWGLFLALLAGGCASDLQSERSETPDSTVFTVNDAKVFFESIVQGAGTTPPHKNLLNPGEFMPQWNQAVSSVDEGCYCIQVPIHTQYRFRALTSIFENCSARAYDVDVEQRLVLLKNRTTSNLSMLIVSLIPDKEYAKSHKNRITGRALSDNDKFNGLVLGYSVIRGRLFSVEKYENGLRKERLYIYNPDKEYAGKAKIANELLKNISILKSTNVMTRNDMEYNPDSDNHEGDGTSEPETPAPDNTCPYCFGAGCHVCNGTGNWGWPDNPGEQDPGDPKDDSDPGSSLDTGGRAYHSCGYLVASGVFVARELYCPKCRVHFWWSPQK